MYSFAGATWRSYVPQFFPPPCVGRISLSLSLSRLALLSVALLNYGYGPRGYTHRPVYIRIYAHIDKRKAKYSAAGGGRAGDEASWCDLWRLLAARARSMRASFSADRSMNAVFLSLARSLVFFPRSKPCVFGNWSVNYWQENELLFSLWRSNCFFMKTDAPRAGCTGR